LWCSSHDKYVTAFDCCKDWIKKGTPKFKISKYWFEDNYGG